MLRARLKEALKGAMKNRAKEEVSILRLIMAALKDRDIAAYEKDNPQGISDDEIRAMMQSMIQQRRESIAFYEKASRTEEVRRETAEISVIESFLPRQLTEEETVRAVEEAIAESEAQGLKDIGKVMAILKERYKWSMDFRRAGQKVRNRLA